LAKVYSPRLYYLFGLFAKEIGLMRPTVSVIIPTYNSGCYIRQAIDSVLAQTCPNYEIIVVDDGSTDDIQEQLTPYRNKIIYQYQSNQGLSAARNTGLDIARGEFLIFLDADDYLVMPTMLVLQLDCFKARPDLDVVHSGWQLVDENGNVLEEIRPWTQMPDLDVETWFNWCPIRLNAMMIRRTALAGIDGFKPELAQAEDVDFVLGLILSGAQFAWLREVTVAYRQHGSSMTNRGRLAQVDWTLQVWQSHLTRSDLPPIIAQNKRRFFYYKLLWAVTRLLNFADQAEIIPFLRQALDYSPYPRLQTMFDWATHLQGHLPARQLVELLKLASTIEQDYPGEADKLLNWWLEVWTAYYLLHSHQERRPVNFEPYRAWAMQEIIDLTRITLATIPGLFYGHGLPAADVVAQFWQDAVEQQLIPQRDQQAVVSLYHLLFWLALRRRRWSEAGRALHRAAQAGLSRSTFKLWLTFIPQGLIILARYR
jgi:glycosyltransferase involved in cell wall biosynthesis